MNRSSRISIRYFTLSFAIAFFLISTLFFFLVTVVHPKAAVIPEPQPLAQEEVWTPTREDALTLLIMGTSSRQAAPSVYILVRFAPEQGKVYLSPLPVNTLVQNQSGSETLGEVYAYGGAAYTRDRLAETLSIDIERYLRIDKDSFITAAAAVGVIEYDLPYPMQLNDGDYSYILEEGLQLLDGRKLVHILGWESYESDAARLELTGKLAAAIVEQRRDVAVSTVADKIFEKIINLIDSDISYADYAPRKPAGEYLARLPGPVAQLIEVTGSESGRGFLLSDTFSASLARAYG